MISVEIYRVIHLIGLMVLFTGLGALAIQGREGAFRKSALMFHGIGLFMILLGGFGMMARLKDQAYSYGSWGIITKLVIFLILGMFVMFIKRGWLRGKTAWVFAILLGGIAAYICVQYGWANGGSAFR